MKGKERAYNINATARGISSYQRTAFWNMKGPQACRPRAVCLAPVPCLGLKMGTGGYTLARHVGCGEDSSRVLCPYTISDSIQEVEQPWVVADT